MTRSHSRMFIAISGTHGSGKSSLVEAFLASHPEYFYEAEPYEVLEELHGETFSAEPSSEDFFIQLEFSESSIKAHSDDELVLFERCPLDYIAYMRALVDLKRETSNFNLLERSIDLAKGVIDRLDLIAYLPADETENEIPEEEDLELRTAMDRNLAAILLKDDLRIFTGPKPIILELNGSVLQRLQVLESECDVT